MSLNEVYEIKIYNKEKIENKKIKAFIKSIENNLNSLNPDLLRDIYEDKKIKVSHRFIYKDLELLIDMHSVSFIKRGYTKYSKYDRYKTRIISEMEDAISKNSKSNNLDKYINDLSNDIENNDLEIITKVDDIKINKNDIGFYKSFTVIKENIDYVLELANVLNKDEFNGKYPQILKIIDGNYLVNTLTCEKAPSVEYYAHTNIDEVYGMEGKWGLVDKDDNVIIKPKYVYPFIECGECLQVMLPNEYRIIDGKKTIISLKHGLLDRKGNVIIPVKYLYMDCMDNSGNLFRVANKETYKAGVLDKNNNVVVPFCYDYIESSPDLELCENTGYGTIYPDNIYQVKVKNNDLFGIYDLKLKKEIIKPKYKYLKIVGYNRFLVGEDYESCNTLINELEEKIEK